MPDYVYLLAVELCELTPAELDSFVQDFPVKLPMQARTMAVMNEMAERVLQYEPFVDALARLKKFRKACASQPSEEVVERIERMRGF